MDMLGIAERQGKEELNMETPITSYKSAAPHIPLEVLTTDRPMVPRTLKGFAASSGIVEGPCTIIRNLQDLHTVQDGAILVCEVASPKVAPFMPFLKGLIAERGGPLAIASGYAREYGIPGVVGVRELMRTIRNGDVIRVDGSKGTVEIVGRCRGSSCGGR
jgi:pyruvate, water dikinase